MKHNVRFSNKVFYIQKYYDDFDGNYFWRYWIFGFYFTSKKKQTKR